MAKIQTNQKEQYYADTREEAEEIVETSKESRDLTMNKITEKHNKYGQYFLVDLTFSYKTPREIMENAPDDEIEGSNHEGIEVTDNGDGTFEVDPNQISIDDVVEESEDTGAEDETVELDVSKDDLPF